VTEIKDLDLKPHGGGKMAVAIDPGSTCGVATLGGKKYQAASVSLKRLFGWLHCLDPADVSVVVVEWSQGQKTAYSRYGEKAKSQMLNVSVGKNQGMGISLVAYLEARGFNIEKCVPSGKGRDAYAKLFAASVGFGGVSEHAADALYMLPA